MIDLDCNAIGSAVRTAFTLGFHEEEYSRVEKDESRLELRIHLIRSMFVLDKHISEFMDLPIAMEEKILFQDITKLRPKPDMRHDGIISTHRLALDAVVQVSWDMSEYIKGYREEGLITTSLGLKVEGECKERFGALPPPLEFSRCFQEMHHLPFDDRIAILHVNVIEAYCRLATTRPFFLDLLISRLRPHRATPTGDLTPLEQLAASCFQSSMRAVNMLHLAYRSKWLPSRHGFLL